MLFDRQVQGYEKFDILDTSIFRYKDSKASMVSLINIDSNAQKKDFYLGNELCYDYSFIVGSIRCWRPGACHPPDYTDNCDECPDYCMFSSIKTITICPFGFGGGNGNGSGFGLGAGSTGGGSGSNDGAPPSNDDGLRPGWRRIQVIESDEKELGISDFSPQNLWWDDNIFDQNVDYKKQTKPSWDNVFKNYPKSSSGGDLDVSNVCALIGGELSNSGITNACAIRVSRALNYSGITIPEIIGQTKKGGDGKNYFLYASHLKNWLSKVLGPPDIHKKISEIGIDPSKFYDHLIGIQNRGIYFMKPKSAESFGATGHATLWGGLDCIGGKNYFGAASDVYIWRLPQ